MQEACAAIRLHSTQQMEDLSLSRVYAHLCNLNSLHMTLRIDKEKHDAEEKEHNNSDI